MVHRAEKARLLIVDDSPVMRGAADKMLGRDFDLSFAEDGEAGWDAIVGDSALQVVFTDLNMPVLDGYGLLQRIRTSEDEDIRNLPVIVVTGAENDDEARERALALGATDFITKPFNSAEIRARARTHSEYRRQRREVAAALPDPVSGALIKEGLQRQLERDLSFCRRHQLPLSLLLVEIGGYRELFLKIGRQGCDGVVARLVGELRHLVRKEDSCGRLGLARFVLILPNSDAAGGAGLAQRIDQRLKTLRFSVRGEPFEVALTTQVTELSPLHADPAQLLGELQSQRSPVAVDAAVQSAAPAAAPGVEQLLAQLRDGSPVRDAAVLAQVAERLEELLSAVPPEQRRDLLRQLGD